MSDVLAALAGPVVGAVGNIGLGALSRSWEQEDWKNRTAVMNQYARENAVLDPVLKVRGMQLAGLNPALANGGSFSGLAPAQGTTSSTPLSMESPDFSKLAQNSLLEAQAKNLESQTRGKDIENKREIDKDLSANAQFRAQLENWLKTEPEDSDKYASAKWLLAQDSVFLLALSKVLSVLCNGVRLILALLQTRLETSLLNWLAKRKLTAVFPTFSQNLTTGNSRNLVLTSQKRKPAF